MAECHTFKIDDKMGVPDNKVRDFLSECEEKMGRIRVQATPLSSNTASLVMIIVMKDI